MVESQLRLNDRSRDCSFSAPRWRAAGALLAALLVGCASARHVESPSQSHRIAYGSDESTQFGDLLLPPGDGPFPLLIVIHGGCWRAQVGALRSTAALAGAFAQEGVATWNVEYRRVGEPGGGWPGTFLDVADAVDFAQTLARRYPIDLSRVVVVGHSAGAHLALWSAARAKLPTTSELHRESPLRLLGVVALAGPGDLRPLGRDPQPVCGTATLEGLLGGPLESVPEHWAEASPAALVPLGVPQSLVAGADDRVIPTAMMAAYESVARESGDRVELVEVRRTSHGDLIVPGSSSWPTVREKVLEMVGGRSSPRD